ncbi:hypothetical protein J6590_023514 [Homalodisca vitripennis]|nr:hypothetical protein J6590_023514 [Homalodisca vitripennis]
MFQGRPSLITRRRYLKGSQDVHQAVLLLSREEVSDTGHVLRWFPDVSYPRLSVSGRYLKGSQDVPPQKPAT